MKKLNVLSLLGLMGALALTSCTPTINPSIPDDTTKDQTSEIEPSTTEEETTTEEESSEETTTEEKDQFNGYYDGISGTGAALKNSLHQLISHRWNKSYDDLWQTYKEADVVNGYIKDIYSNATKYVPGKDQDKGSHKAEGDTYNREHCIPKGWWGGSTSNQGSDPFIVMPSDSYVNQRRSNMPFGETDHPTYQSRNGYSKIGTSSLPGYNSKVFEPADEVKGDMARVYFYAVTCYDTSSWQSQGTFARSGNYFGLTKYARDLFVKWNALDPVDEFEQRRCNIIYGIHHNRNPYIDHPEYVDMIWGK